MDITYKSANNQITQTRLYKPYKIHIIKPCPSDKALIESLLTYGIIVWGSPCNSNLKQLEITY